MNKLLLIDTYNYIHRAYHAMPKTFKDKDGNPTNAIYGFTSMLISTLDLIKPTHVVAALDEKDDKVFRKHDFDGYKANRKELEPELESQIDRIRELIEAFGIKQVFVKGYEADDIIGTLARIAVSKGSSGSVNRSAKTDQDWEVVIVSNDRDITQLLALSDKVRVFFVDNSKEGGSYFGRAEFVAKYGYDPANLIDFKGLRGDSSDNIPGVYGVGDKTATDLIKQYKTIEELYAHLSNIKAESVRNKLIKGKDSAQLSKKLATIITDLDLKVDGKSLSLEDTKIRMLDRLKVLEVLKRYNFKSLIRRLGFDVEGESPHKAKKAEVDKSQLPMF